jgi:hypothetical protein
MFVVVADVGREDSFEVASVHDQDPVEALAAYGADPAFDERVRARCPHRCADDPDAVGAEHLIERRRELAVAVVDQEADRLRPLDERLDDVARLLARPLTGRVRGDARQMHLPGCEFDEHECVQPPEQHGVDGEEVAGDDPAGLGSQEPPPCLGRAPRRRLDPGLLQDRPHTVLAAIRIPSPATSP